MVEEIQRFSFDNGYNVRVRKRAGELCLEVYLYDSTLIFQAAYPYYNFKIKEHDLIITKG